MLLLRFLLSFPAATLWAVPVLYIRFSQKNTQPLYHRFLIFQGRNSTPHSFAPFSTEDCRRKRLPKACFPFAGRAWTPYMETTGPSQKDRLFFVIMAQGSWPYWASSTGSHHSVRPPSPGTSIARCWNQLSFAAPCQCFTPAGILTTSPGCNSRASCPHS